MRWGWVPGLDLAVTQRFDSMARIARVTTPLLILHGTADNVVPHTMADELYRQAGSHDKRLVKIEGGTHSGARGGSEGRAAILEFVSAPLPTARCGRRDVACCRLSNEVSGAASLSGVELGGDRSVLAIDLGAHMVLSICRKPRCLTTLKAAPPDSIGERCSA